MISALVVFISALICVSYSQDSICDKYAQAGSITCLQLVTTVIQKTVGKITVASAPTLKYFDGTKPANSTNFLAPGNAAELNALIQSLIQFFGGALDCGDGTILPYSGPKMSVVHQPMMIGEFESVFFNDQVVQVFKDLGATDEDQVAVRIVLKSLKTSIVYQNSICDRYSNALKLSNNELVTKVVVGVFGEITNSVSPIKKYFDGTKPRGSVNFLDPKNKLALAGLVNGLVTWFGGALMCSDDTIPAYGGDTLDKVHQRMGITNYEFNYFNSRVLDVLIGTGVVHKDIHTVSIALNSTRSQIVHSS